MKKTYSVLLFVLILVFLVCMTSVFVACNKKDTDSASTHLHKYNTEEIVQNPTCTENGIKKYYCDSCDSELIEVIPALGHDLDNNNTCRRCGATDATQGFELELLDNGTYTIKAYSGTKTNLAVPSVYNGAAITRIESQAFLGCSGLSSLVVPNSIVTIDKGAFNGCGGLRSIVLPFVGGGDPTGSSGTFSSRTFNYRTFGFIFGSDTYEGSTNVEQSYGGYSFGWKIPSNLTSVSITGGELFDCSFIGCSMLTNVNLPNNITSIPQHCFDCCTSLETIILPKTVESIGDYAFLRCEKLESIYIGPKVEHIGNQVLAITNSLKEIVVDGDNAVYNSRGNCLIETASKTIIKGCNNSVVLADDDILVIADDAFSACTFTGTVVIPNSVIQIGRNAFNGCNLTTVTILRGIQRLEDGIFEGCSNLTTVLLSDGLKVIGNRAFQSSAIESIVIPDGVESIYHQVFCDCQNLTTVTIPASVIYLEMDVFLASPNLRDIYFGGTKEQWMSYCNGVEAFGPMKTFENWKSYPDTCIVHCLDGDIK